MKLSYIIPAFNEEALLERNVERLRAHLERFSQAEILIVENGSWDRSLEIAKRCAARSEGGAVPIRAFHEAQAGLGHAYDRALRELQVEPGGHWIVFSAADLPFAFTDLEQALPLLEAGGEERVVLGSKAHPQSRIGATLPRRMASLAYRWLRREVVGMTAGDCQGSLFLPASLAIRLRPELRSRDYFYTTELVYLAQRAGAEILEIPVVLQPAERKSTVNLVRDGMTMGRRLFELRSRLGKLEAKG